jgi:hypothetical protein
VKILIGYDGSQSADAAIAAAGKLLAGSDVEAIVFSVWEPGSVAAVHAARFGGPMSAIANDASDVDDRSEQQARKLAEHGARLADTSGFDATAVRVADDRDVTSAIVDEASNLTSTSSCSEPAVSPASVHSWEASLTTSSCTRGVRSSSFRRARHRRTKRTPIHPRVS